MLILRRFLRYFFPEKREGRQRTRENKDILYAIHGQPSRERWIMMGGGGKGEEVETESVATKAMTKKEKKNNINAGEGLKT